MSLGGRRFNIQEVEQDAPSGAYTPIDIGGGKGGASNPNTLTQSFSNRLVDPTLLAQQAILARDPVKYQPILTPENYKNFYDRYSTQPVDPAPYEPIKDYKDRATQYKQDQLAAEVFMPGTGSGGDSSGGESAPSAWSQMSEAERAAWVQENPGAYVAGKTLMSAIMPGGAVLAAMHDPYMNMSLAEYHAGKASQAAMGGMLPEGKGAPVEVATGVPVAPIVGSPSSTNVPTPTPLGPAGSGGSGSVGIDAFGGIGPDVGSVGIDAFGGSGPSVDTGSVGIDAFGGAGPDVGSVGIDAFGGAGPDVGSGGGGGDGGSKIICTAMNEAYGFGSFRNSIWLTYSAQHMTKAHEVGYHTLFLPLVDYGFKRGDGKLNMTVRKALEWIARHRTKDLRAEMRGTKRDITGRVLRFIFEPLCYAVGKLKGY